MIDGKELRVGNIVYKRDKMVMLDITEFARLWRTPVSYSAIPLDENLLLKCGFELDHSKQSWHHRTFVLNGLELEEIDYEYRYNSFLIPSLHKLQNLHFELLGIEIDINL